MSDPEIPTRIVLIGYRGTGKSCVGARLAQALGYECFDADAEIERVAGMNIKDIFEREGEAGFRDREAAVVAELSAMHRTVLALGGGAVLRRENRQALRRAGSLIIWLQAAPQTLHGRIQADTSTSSRRPDLTAGGGLDEIAQLLLQREPLYRELADWRIDTEGKSAEEVAGEIEERIMGE